MNAIILKSQERGFTDRGWLKSYHTFSFGNYYDPHHMGFKCLRVINEDRVAPSEGFPTHSHSDMEIITIVLEGALAHQDSTRESSTLSPGEVQLMTAGSGISHSEFNGSDKDFVHFLQIWILPNKLGLKPNYQQAFFDQNGRKNRLQLVVSPDGHDGSLTIHQDAKLFLLDLDANKQISYDLPPNRSAWIQVIDGSLNAANIDLSRGDGLALDKSGKFDLNAISNCRILLFDLP